MKMSPAWRAEDLGRAIADEDHLLGALEAKSSLFFARFGFRIEEWEVLAQALRRHGAHYEVVNTVDSAYGTRYAVDGPLETPDGRNPLVQTVWIIEKGSAGPRLITAHPLERSQSEAPAHAPHRGQPWLASFGSIVATSLSFRLTQVAPRQGPQTGRSSGESGSLAKQGVGAGLLGQVPGCSDPPDVRLRKGLREVGVPVMGG